MNMVIDSVWIEKDELLWAVAPARRFLPVSSPSPKVCSRTFILSDPVSDLYVNYCVCYYS